MIILSVVGARPNFMKLAPVARALARRPDVTHVVVHTGQHYDPVLSDGLFHDLDLSAPDHHLGVGSGSHAAQTATAMIRLEPVLEGERPDMVLVYGDVNSTLAAALVAAKLEIPVAHVEAGLRSGDLRMPEEVNRRVVDRIASVLFAPSRDAIDNLRAEGVEESRIHFVGNVMADSLAAALPRAARLRAHERFGLADRSYGLVTLHRPSNVDDPGRLAELLDTLTEASGAQPILFPMHPRTRARLHTMGWVPATDGGLRITEPVGYLEMLGLTSAAAFVITDSGGVQEETTCLGVPCLTVRSTTERPITCSAGTNRLVPPEKGAILSAIRAACADRPAAPPIIERWDGRAGERIAAALCGSGPIRSSLDQGAEDSRWVRAAS
ncbi:MAG: non-hydrolyzing UDP-N-acetylglucosamine 2-epimerase [Gemmatimonadales bacterium]